MCHSKLETVYFFLKKNSSNLVTNFYYVIGTMYIYLWNFFDKSLTHFGDVYVKSMIFYM